MDRVSRGHPALFACSPRKCVTRRLHFMFRNARVLPCWPVHTGRCDRRALTASLATAQRRILAAFRHKIQVSSCSNLPGQLSLKHANCHPLTVVNLSSEPWFAATAAGQSERRSSITRGTSLNSGGAQVAQLVEHVTENHGVGGSIPPLGTVLQL